VRETETSRTIYVVGDRFSDFAGAVDAWPLSKLVAAVSDGEFDEGPWPLDVITGQGIDDYALSYLRAALKRREITGQQVRLVSPEHVLAERQHLHKGQAHNVLVAELRQTDDSVFNAELRVHNDNELVLDAQSRPHLQGMVAVEASRQMFVAVAERFFLSSWPHRRYYLVINSMNTEFRNFLFPVPASIQLIVHEARLDDPDRLVFHVEVQIDQAGRAAAVTRIDFAAFDSAVIDDKEQRRAKQTLASVLEDSGRGGR
jgi:hypothetical protein